MMLDVFQNPALGPDSFAGQMASIFQGSVDNFFCIDQLTIFIYAIDDHFEFLCGDIIIIKYDSNFTCTACSYLRIPVQGESFIFFFTFRYFVVAYKCQPFGQWNSGSIKYCDLPDFSLVLAYGLLG